MKWLVILGLLAVAAMFVAVRFRKQIQTAIYVFKMFRKMRRLGRKPDAPEKQIETQAQAGDVELVRCSKCGSWIPRATALKLSRNTFYCSSKCLETAVKA
ncbi:MAG TPA: hypothetical protein VIL74_20060 [Pyrinomonadaceae bacterium]|jgi:hypothetical protein